MDGPPHSGFRWSCDWGPGARGSHGIRLARTDAPEFHMLPTPDAPRGADTQQVGSIMKIKKTKTKVEIATAVGAGYLLGRTHQLRMP